MKTKFLNLNASPLENGKKSGELFKSYIQKEIKFYQNALKEEKYQKVCNNLIDFLKSNFPKYYDEILGKAQGAEVDPNAYFLMMCPEVFEKLDHCTTITCKKDNGKFILSHNEDDEYTSDNFCICKVKTEDGWFATNDIWNMPFGNGFSWNSHGILKTINYCGEKFFNLSNFSRYIGQRHISEAKSLQDLINRCKEIPVASGYHVNAIDIHENKAISIEVYSNNTIDVKEINDYNIHSNHYLRGMYKGLNHTDEGSNSIFRLNKVQELFDNTANFTLENIVGILKYRGKENKFETSILQTKDDPYLTGMNFSFDPDREKQIRLEVFVNDEVLDLDYDLKV